MNKSLSRRAICSRTAIGELPYEQREVVLLHHHGGLKFAQIAKSQEVSINTVLGRYRYGMEKLKSRMNSEFSNAT
jgi:RNA polymerase sigma-70 factor (ECF subfamily)